MPGITGKLNLRYKGVSMRLTKHALERMRQRNVSPLLINMALRKGETFTQHEKNTNFIIKWKKLDVVINERHGIIVTVINYGK